MFIFFKSPLILILLIHQQELTIFYYYNPKMDLMYMDSSEMKENVDVNILHLNQNRKSNTSKIQQFNKREILRQIDSNVENRKIKKTAYIVESEDEESPYKVERRGSNTHRSIDEVSQIIEAASHDVSPLTSPKIQSHFPVSHCETHGQDIFTYNYCIECSIYMLCIQCAKYQHSGHMILTFGSESQTKCLTKQFLIEKIQQSLQKLKSRENDLKNKSAEIQLIAVNVKKMENEVIDKLQRTFAEISQIIRTVYQKDQSFYEQKIDQFYQGYNTSGDEIRENLLTIIDQSFNIKAFKPQLICKEPPAVPNEGINKFKSVLEKTKKFYKSIMDSLEELKTKAEKFSKLSLKGTKQMIGVPTRKSSINKYEKFLSENCFGDNGQETKSSLIRILDTLSR